MYIKRQLEDICRKRIESTRSLYVFGARQTGKTTLIRHLLPDIPYVSLETPTNREFAINDPVGFLNKYNEMCILDEVQKVPDLFSYMQERIDIKNQKFILTGSQNFMLMESVSQSLAGRISLLELPPLSQSELEQREAMTLEELSARKGGNSKTIQHQLKNIIRGYYPEPVSNKLESWYDDYVRTFVERDVRTLLNVKDLSLFQRFLKLCAGRAGQLLNVSSLASDVGISVTACKQWISILEQSGVIFLLMPYFKNFNKRIIKASKLFFMDTGLLNHLLNIKNTDTLEVHPFYGSIVENYVIAEIRKSYLNRGVRPELYFFRDSNGYEIDLLAIEDEKKYAIEIKSSQTISSSLLKSLKKWEAIDSTFKQMMLYGGSESFDREGVMVRPLTAI